MSGPSAQHPVIIVGAGIVGLTLAQSLKQHSIPFEIYERDESLDANQRGWGLTLHWSLEALRSCLSREMFDQLQDIQVDPQVSMTSDAGKFQFLNLQTCETKLVVPPSERIRINRRKFRILLTKDIDVQWNKAITKFSSNIETKTIEVEFQDGTKTSGCVLIGADGSASRTRRFLLDEKAKLHDLPVSLMGVTLRMTAKQIQPLRDIDPLLFNGCDPDNNHFMWYSIQSTPEINGSAGGEEYYEAQFIFSWIVRSPENEPPQDPRERIIRMKEIAKNYDPKLRDIIHSIPSDLGSMVIKLTDWPTLPWDNQGGLITLAGDAAHPMTMYRGEGANHGLADAALLGEELVQAFKGSKSLAQAISDYEADMQPRGHAAVLLSRKAALDAHDYKNLTAESPLISRRARRVDYVEDDGGLES